jgi:hypothetical protein
MTDKARTKASVKALVCPEGPTAATSAPGITRRRQANAEQATRDGEARASLAS